MVIGFVEGFNAADATRVSARGLVEQAEATEAEGGDAAHRVLDGYDRLLRPPGGAARARARARSPGDVVTDVRWGGPRRRRRVARRAGRRRRRACARAPR